MCEIDSPIGILSLQVHIYFSVPCYCLQITWPVKKCLPVCFFVHVFPSGKKDLSVCNIQMKKRNCHRDTEKISI